MSEFAYINPYPAKLIYINFYPFEVVFRYRDHNFKWLKTANICLIRDETFKNLNL